MKDLEELMTIDGCYVLTRPARTLRVGRLLTTTQRSKILGQEVGFAGQRHRIVGVEYLCVDDPVEAGSHIGVLLRALETPAL